MTSNEIVNRNDIALTLAWSAESRRVAQAAVDKLAIRYERQRAKLSIKALAAEIIPIGDGKCRAAKTEDERKQVIQYVLLADRRFCKLEAQLREAQRTLQFYSDQQANYRLLAHLAVGGELPKKPF